MKKIISSYLLVVFLLTGCTTFYRPYAGLNPQNSQFERGHVFVPLDFLGDFLSKPFQLLFWSRGFGNHNISPATEQRLSEFLAFHGLQDVKVRLNQWAPHKEIGRLFINKNIAWPYKIIYFPSTLIASLIGRPLGGLVMSDYYDPGSNSINIVSDDIAIALHEGGHAADFASRRYKGSYGLLRILPGINVFQEAIASDEAFEYLEANKHYDELLRAYSVLYPAYATYISSYISSSPFALLGAIGIGHVIGATQRY
ncbi:MAG: hypothetical protein Q8R76_00145 [Candidatus Omnitrophota bacterium]|nr:hypothetical protein [Candidatus Omnitrophota bacterium]